MKIDNTFSNPRQVNQDGGILITNPLGRDLYIDQSHPQYADIASGKLLGVVTEAIIDPGPTSGSFTLTNADIADILNEIIDKANINLKDGPAKDKLMAKKAL